jgi:hypothetical protein
MYQKAKILAHKGTQKKEAAETIAKEIKNRQRQNVGTEYGEDSHSESISFYLELLFETHGKLSEIEREINSEVKSAKNKNGSFSLVQNNIILNRLRSCLADLEASTVLVSLLEHQNREFRKQFSIAMTQYLNNPDKTDFVRDPSRSINLSLGKWPTQSSGKKNKKNQNSSNDDISKGDMDDSEEPAEKSEEDVVEEYEDDKETKNEKTTSKKNKSVRSYNKKPKDDISNGKSRARASSDTSSQSLRGRKSVPFSFEDSE